MRFPIFMLALFLAPLAQAQEPLRGDPIQGRSLFRMECAACHGADGLGSDAWRRASPNQELPRIGDSAFLVTRSDEDLHNVISTGQKAEGWIPGHAFSNLSALQRWDIIQFLRERSLRVENFFPEAVQFTAKEFQIDEYGVSRLQDIKVPVEEEDRNVVILTAYKGNRGTNESLRLIPWTPVNLDLLEKDDRLGFLSFLNLSVPRTGETIHVGFAFDPAGKLVKVQVRHPDPEKRRNYENILSSFVGQTARGASEFKAPRNLRDGAAWAKEVTRAASLSGEGILMFEKGERARTAFDR